MKRTALLSVFNKDRLGELGTMLRGLGFEILASGGTARHLNDTLRIPAVDVASIVGPEILGHRVVTLSREVYAGILARINQMDDAELIRIGVPRIDLVFVDMYPLVKEILDPAHTFESVVEKIDVGGPTMLHAAAKGGRIVMCRYNQMGVVRDVIKNRDFMTGGRLPPSFLCRIGSEADLEVAAYIAASANFLASAAREFEILERRESQQPG